MKIYVKLPLVILSFVLLASCTKEDAAEPAQSSMNNTSWQATITVTGNVSSQNIFEFSNSGNSFAWHPAGAPGYTGTWSQDGTTIHFTFKETTAGGDYFWDNTGTLSSDGATFTGSMQRRGQQGSGTFTAQKL
jgi:hypothetical protein